MGVSPERLEEFSATVWERGRELYRDLPWRDTHDPYAILLSEVMLQQTQVSRVMGRWEQWLETFPTIADLASAPLPPVLELWQGMGYNRRALNLKRCAEEVVAMHDGVVPSDKKALLALPGIGPSTSAGVRIFAFRQPDMYLETNVRAVFIHELFPGRESVADKELVSLVEATCPQDARVRAWYYALLDYGAHLKKTMPNPTRRSKHYTRQSKFEGSHRQKRAYLLRRVIDDALSTEDLARDLAQSERASGRQEPSVEEVRAILDELEREEMCIRDRVDDVDEADEVYDRDGIGPKAEIDDGRGAWNLERVQDGARRSDDAGGQQLS